MSAITPCTLDPLVLLWQLLYGKRWHWQLFRANAKLNAIRYKSPAGVFLTALVYVVYKIALTFEEPFTGMIYANKDKKN